MRRLSLRAVSACFASLAAIAALATVKHIDMPADPASATINVQAAWVEIGDANQAIARVITNFIPASAGDPLCPQLVIDGKLSRMTLRVAAGTAAQRPTASDPADSKPSSFPVSVCETTLPANAKDVSVASRALPLPKAEPQ
ncbi:serine/threonine protein phosphatase, partial [Burkholderia pseudomallei]|nr:serine/threonine protein phosphatase [Burkholderia pseudomallei]MBD2928333.1 serine/threonine protein phosphatase [Burkholderia pseudomallei]MBD2934506.1 serine/threonine protein phosphatase [Burkholderia pseudomallei]MBD2971380.1 serine/threonine protein phosphatase [Burkholderia pseudomallei]MBM5582228.1 serine/threonine protein phosphatase [Burkholderia pseudomallei]